MATQLFLRQSGITTPAMNNGVGLFEDPGFVERSVNLNDDGALATARGSGVVSEQTFSQTDAPNFMNMSVTFISPPVTAAITISSTITFNIWAREAGALANRGMAVRLYRYRDSDGSLTLIVASDKGTELGTSSAAQNWTAAPTSTALVKGDRLVLFVGTEEQGGASTAGIEIFTATDAASAGVNGDSYMTLTENLSFDDLTDPAGLTLYLTDTTSDVDPGAAFAARKLLTTRGAGVTDAVFLRTGTTWPTPGYQWTIASGDLEIEWYSNRLEAFTLTGKVKMNLRGLMSATGGSHRCGMRGELAIVNEDGSNAVVIGNALVGLSNLGSSEQAFPCVLALPDTTFEAGKRLRLRVYADDCFTNTDEGIGGTGTATLKYAGTSGGASGDAFITLAQSPSDFVPPSEPEVMTKPYTIQPAAIY